MKKVFASILVIALAVVVATPAKAMTNAELLAALNSLSSTQLTQLLSGVQSSASSLPTLTKNMKLGSKGDQVETLQKFLEEKGLLNTDGVYGYFGAKTKAAVKAYQKENGISQTGNCYQLTREAINAEIGSATPSTPATTTPTTPVTLDQTDGSVTATRDNYVGDQTLKKGDTKDIYAVKLQATAGKVAVTRFDVRMDVRPHLYFTKLTLKDSSNGAVIAEKSISSSADVTELTSGSDYLVRFENLNYVVEPNNNKVLVVSATVSANTDKIPSAGASVKVMVGPNGIRTVNGKGFTDSLSVGTSEFKGDIRTVTLKSDGSNGNIVVRLSSNSPLERTQAIKTSGETEGVVLGVFDVKSENQNSKIENLTISLATDGAAPSSFIKRLKLSDGSTTYTADSVEASSTFSALSIKVDKDAWKTLTVTADIADADDIKFVASTTATFKVADGFNPKGIDSNDSNLTATSNAVGASKVTFSENSISVSAMSTKVGEGIEVNNVKVKYPVDYTFTLTNNSDTNLYVSKSVGTFVGTTTSPANTASSTITDIVPLVAASGDTNSAYVISSNGGSRTFTLKGAVGMVPGQSSGSLRISTVYYGTTADSPATASLTTGLESLYQSFIF